MSSIRQNGALAPEDIFDPNITLDAFKSPKKTNNKKATTQVKEPEDAEVVTVEVSSKDALQSSVPSIVKPEASKQVQNDKSAVIVVENKKVEVEFIINFSTPEAGNKVFSVTIKTVSVDIYEDCVSILIEDSVDIKPPNLTPFTLKVRGEDYNVIFAGGRHKLCNKYTNLSFVRIN